MYPVRRKFFKSKLLVLVIYLMINFAEYLRIPTPSVIVRPVRTETPKRAMKLCLLPAMNQYGRELVESHGPYHVLPIRYCFMAENRHHFRETKFLCVKGRERRCAVWDLSGLQATAHRCYLPFHLIASLQFHYSLTMSPKQSVNLFINH